MNKKDYNQAVKKLNCKYAKKNGICSLSKEFCLLGPCLDFKPKYNKRQQRKINRICEKNKIIIEGKRIECQTLDGLIDREIEQGIIDGRFLDFRPYLFCKKYDVKNDN